MSILDLTIENLNAFSPSRGYAIRFREMLESSGIGFIMESVLQGLSLRDLPHVLNNIEKNTNDRLDDLCCKLRKSVAYKEISEYRDEITRIKEGCKKVLDSQEMKRESNRCGIPLSNLPPDIYGMFSYPAFHSTSTADVEYRPYVSGAYDADAQLWNNLMVRLFNFLRDKIKICESVIAEIDSLSSEPSKVGTESSSVDSLKAAGKQLLNYIREGYSYIESAALLETDGKKRRHFCTVERRIKNNPLWNYRELMDEDMAAFAYMARTTEGVCEKHVFEMIKYLRVRELLLGPMPFILADCAISEDELAKLMKDSMNYLLAHDISTGVAFAIIWMWLTQDIQIGDKDFRCYYLKYMNNISVEMGNGETIKTESMDNCMCKARSTDHTAHFSMLMSLYKMATFKPKKAG